MLRVILGVIGCIFDFQKPCALKRAGLRVKDTSRTLCYPVLCGHCLPSCQAERQAPGLLVVFLALLDYVSRAHEIEICPSSVDCVTIISEPTAWIYFKYFGCCLLWAIRRGNFLFFDFWRICFVFVNMVPYGSENLNASTPTNRSG